MYGLTLTYLITALGALMALRRPLIGLYVYVGLAVLRPQFIFGFAGNLSNLSLIVGVAVLIGWAFNGFGSWRLGRGRQIVVLLLIFTTWLGLSALQAQDTDAAFGSLIELAKIVLPFLVGVTMMKGEKDWQPLAWTIVLAQGYVSLEQNMNYLWKGSNSAAEGFGGMDNNCFAVSLVAVVGLAAALALSSKKWWQRALAGVATALILHTTLLTFSRGALVGLLAVGAAAFVVMPKRPKYIAAMLVTLALAVQFTGPQLAARYATAFAAEDERDASAESRVDLWRDCLTVVGAQPLFGVGPANWPVVAASFGWTAGKSAHSVWMQTAAETGIPGVLALLGFFIWAAIKLWPIARARQTETNKFEVAVAMGIILSIVGFVVSGQFVSVPALEVPYYVTMVGVAMLKTTTRKTVAGAAVSVKGRPPLLHQQVQRLQPSRASAAGWPGRPRDTR